MPCTLQDVVLLPHLLQGALVAHEGLVDRLQGHELASQAVDGEVHLTKRALADHFADLVVVYLRLMEASLDAGQDSVQDHLSWSQSS